jgi:HK97 family phage prohead protease
MFKSLIKSITTIEDVDNKGRVKVAANAIGNVDSDKDMSMPGSFTKTLSENFARTRWLLNHDKGLLLGVPLEGKEEGEHLVMVGQMNMKKQIAIDTYEDYKLFAEHGKSLEHSIGVNAIKFQNKGNIRQVSEWKLWEYSTLTAWGANENTPMLGIKEMADTNEAIELLNLMLKKGNYSDEKFKEIEKQLNTLKSLCNEPLIDTHEQQPIDNSKSIIEAIQTFKNTLNQ